MGTKSVKVKTLADKYGVSVKEIIKELESQGFGDDVKSASSVIPPDAVELVKSYLDELMAKRGGEPGRGAGNRDGGGAVSAASAGQQEVHIKGPVIVKSLAEALGKRPNEVITSLMMMNVLASINQMLEPAVAVELAAKMGFTLVIDKRGKEEHVQKDAGSQSADAPEEIEFADNPKDIIARQPIVTFMGHVDHGKTSLQDAIRKTRVAAGEAGGITQHIGASIAHCGNKSVTFVDTPGHEAFTAMRARGANVTDIVVLVVAADDGFMPQTIEAMNHARAAKVPIIVAMNKIDLPNANPDKVLLNMQQNGLMPEDWGGTIGVVKVSAKTGQGIDDLLERILLEAEMLELKGNPKRPAEAFVLESQLEQGYGPTASIVVKNGTLHVGDPIICGEYYGKVKGLIDHRGQRIKSAGPEHSGEDCRSERCAGCRNEACGLQEREGSQRNR